MIGHQCSPVMMQKSEFPGIVLGKRGFDDCEEEGQEIALPWSFCMVLLFACFLFSFFYFVFVVGCFVWCCFCVSVLGRENST